jgi:FkbM family methyltransferase
LARYFKDAILNKVDQLIEVLSRKSHIISFREHHFIHSLNAQSLVLDLGAHKGEFSAQISREFGCRCIAVEANPALFGGIVENALVKKYHYAVSGQSGPVHFHVSENPEASSTMKKISDFWGTRESIQVPGICLEDLLEKCQIKTVDLLKVDIEGGEIEMFKSMSDQAIRGVRQITIEFHSFCNPAIQGDISQIKRRFRKLGFLCLPFPLKTSLSTDCDTLFINGRGMDFGWKEWLRIFIPLYILKAALGIPILRLKVGEWKTRRMSSPA